MSNDNEHAHDSPEAQAKAALNRVLNTLENLLDPAQAASPGAGDPLTATPTSRHDDPGADMAFTQQALHDGNDVDVPLLNDIISDDFSTAEPSIGTPFSGDYRDDYSTSDTIDDDFETSRLDPGVYAAIAERLGSELEVIIQSGLDRYAEVAREQILNEIKTHLSIILPEIIADAAALVPPEDQES